MIGFLNLLDQLKRDLSPNRRRRKIKKGTFAVRTLRQLAGRWRQEVVFKPDGTWRVQSFVAV